MKEIAIAIVVAAVISVGLVWAIIVGTGKSEIVECNKWSQEADAYPGYFLASWQKSQCDAHGIFISSPVK